ncbi:hypothetical protein ACJX0J_028991 [Zea mays]
MEYCILRVDTLRSIEETGEKLAYDGRGNLPSLIAHFSLKISFVFSIFSVACMLRDGLFSMHRPTIYLLIILDACVHDIFMVSWMYVLILITITLSFTSKTWCLHHYPYVLTCTTDLYRDMFFEKNLSLHDSLCILSFHYNYNLQAQSYIM